jgi:hypothetical protein
MMVHLFSEEEQARWDLGKTSDIGFCCKKAFDFNTDMTFPKSYVI